MTNVMIDIETMGNQSFSSILSIGAVRFDLKTGEIGDKFYTTIDLESCLHMGLLINADTLKWWMKQNDQAKKDLFDGDQLPINQALYLLSQFINKKDIVWGNSARFDCGILSDAYNKCRLPLPWDFRDERCVRTLVSFYPKMKSGEKMTGTYHNAIDDCIHQINYCSKIYNKLNYDK
jgi:DNA polymerase III epsilon subunit-like protein